MIFSINGGSDITFTAANTSGSGGFTNAAFTAFDSAGDTLSFTFTGNGQANLRNIEFSFDIDATPIPEPSSTALLGLGGLALILRRRR